MCVSQSPQKLLGIWLLHLCESVVSVSYDINMVKLPSQRVGKNCDDIAILVTHFIPTNYSSPNRRV